MVYLSYDVNKQWKELSSKLLVLIVLIFDNLSIFWYLALSKQDRHIIFKILSYLLIFLPEMKVKMYKI